MKLTNGRKRAKRGWHNLESKKIYTCDMEPEGKIPEDVVTFMRKRSETDAPKYTARLKTYLDVKQKRRRAAAARQRAIDHEKKPIESSRSTDKCVHQPRSLSKPRSEEPEDAACRRPRRRRRRRVRSCRRRSRRRRRGRRCSCRRRRKRSSSRRRRRRSCRRRRTRRRRRGCCG